MRTPSLPRLPLSAGIALATFAILIVAALAADLLRQGPITRLDPGLSVWLYTRAHPWMVGAMSFITDLNSNVGVSVMASLMAAGLAWRRMFGWLAFLVAAVPGGLLLNVGLKHTFARARPVFDGFPVSDIATYSFPSGHAAGATVWWGFLLIFWFALHAAPAWRLAGVAVAAAMVLLTAFSRVYLGFHYASDVAAAMAEGVAWLALCATIVPRLTQRPGAEPR